MMVLSIKIALSLNQLKAGGRGGFKEDERERVFRTSAIRADLMLVAEIELYQEPRLRVMTPSTKVALKPSCRDKGATRSIQSINQGRSLH